MNMVLFNTITISKRTKHLLILLPMGTLDNIILFLLEITLKGLSEMKWAFNLRKKARTALDGPVTLSTSWLLSWRKNTFFLNTNLFIKKIPSISI